MLLVELQGRQVAEAAVGTHGVVMPAPGLDDHTCLFARAKPLSAQAFVSEAAVEALVGAVLPRLAGIDQRGADARFGGPLEDCAADELRAIVRAQEQRRTVRADEPGEDLDHAPG